MADIAVLLRTPKFALKLVELVFSFLSICVIIDGYPIADTLPKFFTIYGTMIGFFMITIIIILLFMLDTPPHQFVLQVVCVAGFIMWLTTGSLVINQYQKYAVEPRVVASGVFALLNAFTYLIDGALEIAALGSAQS